MLEILPDLGLIFIGLALFGFILIDAFNWELFLKPPTMYKQYVTTIFHYVSIALFALSFLIIFLVFIIAAPNQDNSITKFFNFMFTFIESAEKSGVLTSGFSTSIKNNLALGFFPAFFYFGMIAVTLALGRFFRFTNEAWVTVELKDGEKNYPKIISDDDDFFYFEQADNPGLWEAIRKDDVKKIVIIKHHSRFSDKIKNYIKNISDLKSKGQYREIAIVIIFDSFPYFPLAFLILLFFLLPVK